ncbi:hypothetical protein COV16_05110 [Candidatus Woesearchaeota archaeon CG10_big_fil_rev_8_21_14_0_10_34_8]|nr:MAG: hypothetical protein COV16_05110 [Candidatus Woesearchaeota archaeon CG10_big_fil_rev_8_21_14_0_10_34_8]
MLSSTQLATLEELARKYADHKFHHLKFWDNKVYGGIITQEAIDDAAAHDYPGAFLPPDPKPEYTLLGTVDEYLHFFELKLQETGSQSWLGECFWWSGLRTPDDKKIAHLVRYVGFEETPAGTEGQEYHAFCGETMLSFYYPGHAEPRFGTIEEAISQDHELCDECTRHILSPLLEP